MKNVDQEALAAPGHAENGVDLLPVLAIDRSAVFDSPRVAVEHFPKLRQDVDGFLVHQVRPPGGVLRAAHGIDLGHYDGPEFFRVVQRRQPETVLGEVVAELRRVTWPTRQETMRLSLMVIAVSAAVGVFLGLVDIGFTRLFRVILGN